MIRPNDEHSLANKAQAAFAEAARDVIARARAHNTPVVVWRDNKVVYLTIAQAEQELSSNENDE